MYKFEEEYQMMLERLKKICKQKKMTQYALAKATGMSSSSISSLMKGETKPCIFTLLMICEVLNVSIGELFESRGFGTDASEETLIRVYRDLPTEKQKMLNIYMDMLVQYEGEL